MKQTTQVQEQRAPEPPKDRLARAIDMAMMLEVPDNDMEVQQDEVDDSTADRDLDKAIDNVLNALETPSSSSSSDSSSETGSSSESSDSDEWGAVKTIVRNPFAKKTATESEQSTSVASKATEPAADSGEGDPIKRTPPLKKVSVLIKKLTKKVLEKFDSSTTASTTEQAATMSAKNITKGRSASRGRTDKKDRFNKGRNDDDGTGNEGNGQEQPGEGREGNGQGQGQTGGATGGAEKNDIPSGKRPRDSPKTGMHDDTMGRTWRMRNIATDLSGKSKEEKRDEKADRSIQVIWFSGNNINRQRCRPINQSLSSSASLLVSVRRISCTLFGSSRGFI